MSYNDKWVISGSGHYMFVVFNVDILVSDPGFTAKIHYGNKIKNIKILCITKYRLFSVNCGTVINGEIGFCACHSCSELEGNCDFNDQCHEGLRCGSNNCLDYFGFDVNTDCCYAAILGDDDFCTIDEPCEINEGDCDSNDECKNHLFCGSKNCLDSLVLSSVDCCEPKGVKNITYYISSNYPYRAKSFASQYRK